MSNKQLNQLLRYLRNYFRKEQRRSKSLGAMIFFGLLAAFAGMWINDHSPSTEEKSVVAKLYQKESLYKCALNRVIDGDSVLLDCELPDLRKSEEGRFIDTAIDAVKDLVIRSSPELEKITKNGNKNASQKIPTLKQKTEIRVWGIDAPELGQKPWGDRSKRLMQQLAGKKGSPITLLVKDIDHYNRVVGAIYTGHLTRSQLTQTRDLGFQLVKAGEAVVYDRYNNEAHYKKAEENAQQKALGIWSQEGSQQNPGKWRQLNRRSAG